MPPPDAERGALFRFARDLLAALPNQLAAVYHSPSDMEWATSCGAPTLWLCIQPGTDLNALRQVYRSLWQRLGRRWVTPAVGILDDLERYSQHVPLGGSRLASAELVAGSDILAHLRGRDPLESVDRMAEVARETLFASSLLAESSGDRPTTGGQPRQWERLDCAAGLAGLAPGGGYTAVQFLAFLHSFLDDQRQDYPSYRWDGEPPVDTPPEHLPGLLSLYGLEDQLIIVMPRLGMELLQGIEWTRVTELVSGEFGELLVAAPWQLRLVALERMPIQLELQSLQWIWGSKILSDCSPQLCDVLSQAAGQAIRFLVEELIGGYLIKPDEELGAHVHAVQNVLLNIQLRNELLGRARGVVVGQPPEPLPGRGTPVYLRVAANVTHFRWWSERLSSEWREMVS